MIRLSEVRLKTNNDVLEIFGKEYMDIFNVKIKLLKKIMHKFSVLIISENFEREICHWLKNEFSSGGTIPIFCIGHSEEFLTTPLGYAVLVNAIFLRKAKYPNLDIFFMINVKKMPFQRVTIDCDVNDGDDEEAKEKIFYMWNKLNIGDYVITARSNVISKSFHVVSAIQYDAATAGELKSKFLTILPNNSGTKIDDTVVWGLPGARFHLLEKETDMSWSEFKSISVIDVWDKRNFLSSLTTYMNADVSKLDHFIVCHGSKCKMTLIPNEDANNKVYFFDQYSNYKNFQINNNQFSITNLISFLNFDNNQTINEQLSNIEHSSEDETTEFYKIYFKTKIAFKTNIEDIFSNLSHDEVESFGISKDFIIENINKCNFYKKNNEDHNKYQEFLSQQMETLILNPEEMASLRDIDLFTQKITIKNEIFKSLARTFYFKKWDFIVMFTFFNNLNLCFERYKPSIITSFKRLGGENVFAENVGSIILDFSTEFERHEIEESNALLLEDVIIRLLNEYHISSVLSFFLRSGLYQQTNSLILIITVLYSLEIKPEIKKALLLFVNGVCLDSMEMMTTYLVNQFPNDDILFTLCGFTDENYEAMFIKFENIIKVFLKNNDEDQPPKKKKKGKNGDGQSGCSFYDDIFLKEIVQLFHNHGYYFIYHSRGYHMVRLEQEEAYKRNFSVPCIDELPASPWYRRHTGIFCSITGLHEHHSPALKNLIYIKERDQNDDLALFNYYDYSLKNRLLDCILKARHFIELCEYNKLAVIILAPLNISRDCQIDFKIKSVYIDVMDFTNENLKMPKNLQESLKSYNKLNFYFNYLYSIIATLSQYGAIEITNIRTFLMLLSNSSSIDQDDRMCTENEDDNVIVTKKDELYDFLGMINQCMQYNDVLDINKSTTPGRPLLETKIKLNNIDKLNIFTIRECFNGIMNFEVLAKISECQIKEDEFKFIFVLLSFIIRMSNRHLFAQTTFFRKIQADVDVIYEELSSCMKSQIGCFLHFQSMEDITHHFRKFCENTTLVLNDEKKFPRGYKLNATNREYTSSLENDIYEGMAHLILDIQFNSDILIDVLKTICSYTHVGNLSREALSFLNRSGTGKNTFLELVVGLFKTNYNQQMTDRDLTNSPTDAGSLSIPLNTNLLIWFDEITKLSVFMKTLINFGMTRNRAFFSKDNDVAEFRVNTHVIFTANNDPATEDAATIARITPIDRRIQFVEYDQNAIIERKSIDGNIDKINNILGLQLLVEKLPVNERKKSPPLGLFLYTWLCSDIFLYTFSSPVSRAKTPTLKRFKERFNFGANPSQQLLDSGIITKTFNEPMHLLEFDKALTKYMKAFKARYSSNFKMNSVMKEIKDQLVNYIDGDVIYVCFKDIETNR